MALKNTRKQEVSDTPPLNLGVKLPPLKFGGMGLPGQRDENKNEICVVEKGCRLGEEEKTVQKSCFSLFGGGLGKYHDDKH